MKNQSCKDDANYVRVVRNGKSESIFTVILRHITPRNNDSSQEEWKYDADYISYVESGESAAVFVIRDVVIDIDTKGKWIDIVSLSTYFQDKDGRGFNWIIAEIFPRRINPDYSTCRNDDEKRYLTWKTAHEDISEQRSKGYNGPKFLVLCSLHDKNEGKSVTWKLTGIIKKYSAPDGKIREVELPPQKPESITEELPHEWEYQITFLHRLNKRQADRIELHRAEIEDKIQQEGKSSPEIFGFKDKKGVNNIAKAKQARRNYRPPRSMAE